VIAVQASTQGWSSGKANNLANAVGSYRFVFKIRLDSDPSYPCGRRGACGLADRKENFYKRASPQALKSLD